MASFTTIMTLARSALAYSSTLACWAWRGSCQSVGTALTRQVRRGTGSRSKTRSRPQCFAPKLRKVPRKPYAFANFGAVLVGTFHDLERRASDFSDLRPCPAWCRRSCPCPAGTVPLHCSRRFDCIERKRRPKRCIESSGHVWAKRGLHGPRSDASLNGWAVLGWDHQAARRSIISEQSSSRVRCGTFGT